jgi:hypothetical protein
MRLLPPAAVIPSQKTAPTPTIERHTPMMPLHVGFSKPNMAPKTSPHTGAVAKMRPVFEAEVMLTPNVKQVWAVMTPRHPKPAM